MEEGTTLDNLNNHFSSQICCTATLSPLDPTYLAVFIDRDSKIFVQSVLSYRRPNDSRNSLCI